MDVEVLQGLQAHIDKSRDPDRGVALPTGISRQSDGRQIRRQHHGVAGTPYTRISSSCRRLASVQSGPRRRPGYQPPPASTRHWSQRVDGLRVTDAATMRVVEDVLFGEVNARIVREIGALDGRAVGVSAKDAGIMQVRKHWGPDRWRCHGYRRCRRCRTRGYRACWA